MGTGKAEKSTNTDLPLNSPQRDDGVKLVYEVFKHVGTRNWDMEKLKQTPTQPPTQTPTEAQNQVAQPSRRIGQPGDPQSDMRRQVARRRGMTRSILAGESTGGVGGTLG
jgi:hypothetical protein